MLPLRFVAESLGCKVSWNPDTRTITITYAQEEVPKAIQFKGKGDNVTKMFNLQTGIAVVSMQYTGTPNSNFVVELLDKNGKEISLLANEIGSYKGTQAIGVYKDNIMGATPGKYLFNITADGNWTVTVHQPVPTAPQSLPANFTGKGDEVSLFFTLNSGLTKFTMHHNGKSNFIVTLISSNGQGYNLANEIGAYNGTKAIGVKKDNIFGPVPGIYLITVTADGDWSISISQ